MKNYSDRTIHNIGTGDDIMISEFARIIADSVGCKGVTVQDATRPDGTLRRLVDVSPTKALDWSARIELRAGLTLAYEDFKRPEAADR